MADVNEKLMGRKGARRFVARLAIGGGLRRSTRLKKEKDRSSEAAVSSDEKEETKQRGCSSSVLKVVAKGKEVRRGLGGVASNNSNGDGVFGGFARRQRKRRSYRWWGAVRSWLFVNSGKAAAISTGSFLIDIDGKKSNGCLGKMKEEHVEVVLFGCSRTEEEQKRSIDSLISF
ncbi:unnamed protein product [Lactuca saligna]|uniref:Uncharacterized protein n=1 Tax=Lactuca saligna TaxID=75948 RepID=A0AA36EGC4_LACSI|nr:unnamed protein product [Lactuca saligna]